MWNFVISLSYQNYFCAETHFSNLQNFYCTVQFWNLQSRIAKFNTFTVRKFQQVAAGGPHRPASQSHGGGWGWPPAHGSSPASRRPMVDPVGRIIQCQPWHCDRHIVMWHPWFPCTIEESRRPSTLLVEGLGCSPLHPSLVSAVCTSRRSSSPWTSVDKQEAEENTRRWFKIPLYFSTMFY